MNLNIVYIYIFNDYIDIIRYLHNALKKLAGHSCWPHEVLQGGCFLLGCSYELGKPKVERPEKRAPGCLFGDYNKPL